MFEFLRTQFDQNSPVQPVSESSGGGEGPLSVTGGRGRRGTKEILESNLGCNIFMEEYRRLLLNIFEMAMWNTGDRLIIILSATEDHRRRVLEEYGKSWSPPASG